MIKVPITIDILFKRTIDVKFHPMEFCEQNNDKENVVKLTIQLINLLGEVLESKNVDRTLNAENSQRFSIEKVKSGIYFIQVFLNKEFVESKCIKINHY